MRQRRERMIKMIKKTFKTLLGILTILSLVFSTYFAFSMYEQYEESVRWDSSSLLSNIHNVPPALAKNYVFGNEEKLAQALTDVNSALDVVLEEEGVPKEHLKDFTELCQRADELFQESDLEDNNITKPLRSLQLYIQTEQAIVDAYEVVDTEDLIIYSDKLVSRLNERDNTLDAVYLNKLGEVAKDYQSLENFSKRTLEALGVVEADTLYVDLKVDRAATEGILNDLSNTQLLKFSNARRLEAMLRGDPWDDILAHNQSTKEYYSWKKSEEILESLLITNYKPVSDFKELQDALDYQSGLRLETMIGYELDIENSTINSVYYQGELLDDDMYVKKGSKLFFDIEYVYTEIEIIEPDPEPEEQDTDKDEDIEINIPSDRPVKEPEKKPVEKPIEKPIEKPVEKPVEKPIEKPKDEEIDIPNPNNGNNNGENENSDNS